MPGRIVDLGMSSYLLFPLDTGFNNKYRIYTMLQNQFWRCDVVGLFVIANLVPIAVIVIVFELSQTLFEA